MNLVIVFAVAFSFVAPLFLSEARAVPLANASAAPHLPISTANAEHYTWGDPKNPCDGWYLVQSPDLSVIEERMPPGTFEQRHLHHKSRQFFYVLAGELTMEAGGVTHVVRVGEGIEVAPETPHQAMNHGVVDLRILVTSQPPSHGDRVETPR